MKLPTSKDVAELKARQQTLLKDNQFCDMYMAEDNDEGRIKLEGAINSGPKESNLRRIGFPEIKEGTLKKEGLDDHAIIFVLLEFEIKQ